MFNLSQIGIRKKINSDPYYRFRSVEEIKIAAELGVKINVNQASIDDWLRLPGFSIHQARSLVELVGMGVQLLCIEDVAAAINLPVQRLLPFDSILHFEYYHPLSSLNPQRVNVNLASLAEIDALPVINNDLSTKIAIERQENGAYRNLADLQRRLGLDSKITSRLMYYLVF
jgi:DNA uptake protein ComE-like DNA-binding protein